MKYSLNHKVTNTNLLKYSMNYNSVMSTHESNMIMFNEKLSSLMKNYSNVTILLSVEYFK